MRLPAPVTAIALLSTLVVWGCSDDSKPSGMTVSAQKWDPVNLCYAPLPYGDALPVYKSSEAVCPTVASATVTGGVDLLRLIVGYGDLMFAQSADPPTPTLTLTLDGADTPTGATVVRVSDANPTIFEGTLRAPTRVTDEMMFGARVASGFDHPAIGPYVVTAANLSVTVDGCSSTGGCDMVGGVGSASLKIEGPGVSDDSAVLSWTLSGITQAQTATAKLASKPGDPTTMTGTVSIPVPVAPDNTLWSLTAIASGRKGSASVTLHRPRISAVLAGCQTGAACALQASSTTTLTVTAPQGIQTGQASVTTLVGNAASTTPFTITLAEPNVDQGTVQGQLPLSVPSAAGQVWVINTTVAGYAAQTIAVTISP